MPKASGDAETSLTEVAQPSRNHWHGRIPQRHAIASVAAALAIVIALVPDPTAVARAPVVEVSRDSTAASAPTAVPTSRGGHPTLQKDPGDLLAPPDGSAADVGAERALTAPFGVLPRPDVAAPAGLEPVAVVAETQVIRPTPRPTPRPTQRPAPASAPRAPAAAPAPVTTGGGGGGGWIYDPDMSWYGPGFYGNRTACGHTYSQTIMGVAHKTLPCGTSVQFRYGGRVITVPVIDRGPYIAGRNWDLSAAACQALAHCFTGPLEWRLP